MKFGRIIYGYNPTEGKHQKANLGDAIQTFAVDGLYRYMGIPEGDVLNVRRTELSSYSGEKVVLPFQGCFINTNGAPIFPVSENIVPEYFGFCSSTRKDKKYISEMPENKVIGCRDEHVWRYLRDCKKNVYLTGCLTATFPRRENEGDTVFLVDAPAETKDVMPKELLKKTEKLSQSFDMKGMTVDESYEKVERATRKQLSILKERASLVVTSRLHVASPCVAMGIPVILFRKYFDDRYEWIDKFIPLYTLDKASEIDWSPTPPEYEDIKKLMFDTAGAVIREDENGKELAAELHAVFMDRNRCLTKKPFYVKAYHSVIKAAPKTANFLREVVLKKYTAET
ncbi:MAG: polysaccharide pyruvyl transferase family protein [Clostridiales bacterium]|nr:polysaccharide pyruvyl transferase family protein [Clostridiales bacterium]